MDATELFRYLTPRTLAAVVADLRDEAMLALPPNDEQVTVTCQDALDELETRHPPDEVEAMVATARFRQVRVFSEED